MSQLYNSLSEFPYAEAAKPPAKRAPLTQQGVPPPWTTSIVESTTVCAEDKVFVIGGFDTCTQNIVPYARVWDAVTHAWTRLPDAPVRVVNASAAALPAEGSIILFGGWDGTKCSAELWHLHPRRPDGVTADADVVSPPSLGVIRGGRPSTTPTSARGRSSKGDYEAALRWDRLEADARVSARPVGRYGHALAFGFSAPTERWQTSPPSPPAAGSLQPSGKAMGPAAAATMISGAQAPTSLEPVLYLFGGNDTTSRLNDLWRLWIAPSIQLRVAQWERLKATPGVCPCPREDAVLAFDTARQCLWLYGGSTATGVLDDLWCLSLVGESSETGFTWTPVYPLGGHRLAPGRWNLSTPCMPAAAVVEDGSLYVLFNEAPMSSKCLHTNDREALYRFCLTTHHWVSCPLCEEKAASSRPSSSLRTSHPLAQQASSFRVVAACACNRFLFWLKDSAGDEAFKTQSRPAVIQVELNLLDTKPTKRCTERSR